jgi:hypothetical protein
MKKNSASQSGIFNPRTFLAFSLCLVGVFLALFSFASTAPSEPQIAAATRAFGGPDPTVPGNPRYQNFYAPAGSSAEPGSGEFNIGFDPVTHRIMVMNIGPIWRLTPPELLAPAKPECCDALWEDKSPKTTSLAAMDPILWTDQKTGRTFAANSFYGANFSYAYTDGTAPFNDGELWVEAGIAPPNGGQDHETLGSGPYPAALSALSTPVNKGEMVFYCSQAGVGPAACQRSDDLGSSYGPGVLAYDGFTTACGGLHGHVHVAPDGTVWLPVNQCAGRQGGAVSTTAGARWNEFIVSGNNDVNGGAAFTATSQANGADPSVGIDSASTAYYCYVNNEGSEGHVHVAVSTDGGLTWIRDVDVGASHGIINAAETEAVGGSAGRASCGFIGTNISGNYESGTFSGVWYAFIATTYDQGRHWVTVNATPNDPVQNHTGIWQQGGSGQNGDRNLLDFNEITIDDKGRVLYGYSDGCHSLTCIQGDNSANERGAFMRVARQFGGKPLLALFDPNPVEPVVPKPPCLSGTRDCSAVHLTWKAPDNGGSDIINYQIFRGTSAGTEVLLGQTGNTNVTFDDAVDPSVPHYFYVVKAVNGQGIGLQSNEANMSSELIPSDDVAATFETQWVIISVLANDCGVPPLTVTAVSAPSHGTANNNNDGTVTYTPAPSFFGTDSFTYTVRNGLGATAVRTVRVTVSPLCPPVASGIFSDPFDPMATPGWFVDTAANNVPASVTWTVTPDPNAHSVPNSFYSDATTLDKKDDRLVAPPQKLSNTSHLIFWHRYQFEAGYDGGVIEVSTDGGASWVDVIAGGGTFVSGGYNGTISPSYGSPVAGRPAWTGGDATVAMTKVEINLGAFAGYGVLVRFRLACDPFIQGSNPGVGWWIDDVQFTKTLVEGPCPAIVSRKTHGSAGTFDIDLPLPRYPIPGIECRTGGANGDHTIVFTFANPLASVTGASVTSGVGSISSRAIGSDPHQYIVYLSGVTNAQRVTLTLTGISDTAGNITPSVAVTMGVLFGDVNGNGRVTNADVAVIQAKVGAPVGQSTFQLDVNANGTLSNGDVAATQAKAGTQLPP